MIKKLNLHEITSDYMNKSLDIGLDYPTSHINDFIGDLFNNDTSTIKYLQKLLGYDITGHTQESCLIDKSYNINAAEFRQAFITYSETNQNILITLRRDLFSSNQNIHTPNHENFVCYCNNLFLTNHHNYNRNQ